MMKRFLLIALGVLVLPWGLDAQEVEVAIERALMAAPASMRAEASVIAFAADGSIVVLREGTNGLMCWDSSQEPGQQGRFSSQCTSELNRARVEQNHRIVNSGGSPEEIQAMFDEAEENGTREVAAFGTVYYHLMGDDPETGRMHTNVAVPYATEESLGMPDERRNDALWIMDAGTSGAHLMMPGM